MLWMLSTLGASDRVPAGGSLMLLRGFVGDGVGTWGYQLEALSDAFTVIAWTVPEPAIHQSCQNRSGWPTMRTVFPDSCAPWTWPARIWRGYRSALSWR
jgi:hypothetical protein